MKDFANNTLEVGDIVVVKPSTRTSSMRFGYIKSLSKRSVTVGSYMERWSGDGHTLVSANFTPSSVYVVRAAHLIKGDHCYPNGFPKELWAHYYSTFLARPTS